MKYQEKDIDAMAKAFAIKHPNPNLTWEDHRQEIWVGLLEGLTLSQCYDKLRKQLDRMCPGVKTPHDPNERNPFILYLSDGFDCETEPTKEDVYTLKPQAYREMQEKMYQLIDTLPTSDQTLVLLRSFGYTNGDLAKVFKCPVERIKKRTQRLMKHLREKISA